MLLRRPPRMTSCSFYFLLFRYYLFSCFFFKFRWNSTPSVNLFRVALHTKKIYKNSIFVPFRCYFLTAKKEKKTQKVAHWMHLLSAKSKYIAGINSCWPSTEATNWNPQRSDFMSMMMSCVCERAWTWDKFMNGRNHCKLQLLLVLLLLSLLFLWFMTKMKHDFVLHFTINCEEFSTGTMNWPPASRWMRHVPWTYNNCGADNCTASWREQNETIPFTTTAQTPPSHVILFFYDCGGVGGTVWLTDLQKEPHKKSLKIFLMFFSSSSDLQKNLFLFVRMEKRRKT